MEKMTIIGIILIAVSVLSFGIFYFGNKPLEANRSFSNHDVLANIWENYKKGYVDASGRTVDPASTQGQDITTSEGQSYTMLRSVWMSDKATFDLASQWTLKNLQQQGNGVFSWLYGKRPDGSAGILIQKGGANSASDADTDIALSLVFAYSRWNDPQYLAQAKEIINGIWDNDVAIINGNPYMTADNLEKNSQKPIINPSYLAPYAYRIFAVVDRNPQHDWGKLVETSYRVLNESIYSPLDKQQSANIPANWVRINRLTEKLEATGDKTLGTDFSFDAMRVAFRVALDSQWYQDPRANEVLYRMQFLADEFKKQGYLFTDYAHDGQVLQTTEAPSMYGGSIGYFMATDSDLAQQMFTNKLQILYDPTAKSWKKDLPYYDDNWAWFGMALYYGELQNLAKSLAI